MIELYLAHPFSYRKAARKIEMRIEKGLGVKLINPFYDTEEKALMRRIDDGMKLWKAREKILKSVKQNQTVDRDLSFCRTTDGVLWLVPYHAYTVGAPMEAFYAHSLGKPVYTITYQKNINHPFLKYVSTQVFTTATAFMKWWKEGIGERLNTAESGEV